MAKVAILVAVLAALPGTGLFPQGSLLREPPALTVEINLLQQCYRINEPVPVRVLVVNDSDEPVRFSLAKHLFMNFGFRVRTLQNIEIRERESFQLQKLGTRQDNGAERQIVLAPGERFGRVIDVADWLRLVEPGVYELTGFFWLSPRRSSADFRYRSGSKRFVLQPPRDVAEVVRRNDEEKKQHDGKRLSAGETVDFLISAKRSGDWANYFRYMDLGRLINVFPAFRTRYVAADVVARADVMTDFRRFLRVFPSDQIDYHFVQTVSVTRDEETLNERAEVESLIVYKTGQLVERKLYHFSLYRKMDRWFVFSYYVVNDR